MNEKLKNAEWDEVSEDSYGTAGEKQNKKLNRSYSSSSYSVYNEKEVEYLDRYLPIVDNAIDVC